MPDFSAMMFWSSQVYCNYSFILNVYLSPVTLFLLFCHFRSPTHCKKWTIAAHRELLLHDSYFILGCHLYSIEWISFTLFISKALRPFKRCFPDLSFFTFLLCVVQSSHSHFLVGCFTYWQWDLIANHKEEFSYLIKTHDHQLSLSKRDENKDYTCWW